MASKSRPVALVASFGCSEVISGIASEVISSTQEVVYRKHACSISGLSCICYPYLCIGFLQKINSCSPSTFFGSAAAPLLIDDFSCE